MQEHFHQEIISCSVDDENATLMKKSQQAKRNLFKIKEVYNENTIEFLRLQKIQNIQLQEIHRLAPKTLVLNNSLFQHMRKHTKKKFNSYGIFIKRVSCPHHTEDVIT